MKPKCQERDGKGVDTWNDPCIVRTMIVNLLKWIAAFGLAVVVIVVVLAVIYGVIVLFVQEASIAFPLTIVGVFLAVLVSLTIGIREEL